MDASTRRIFEEGLSDALLRSIAWTESDLFVELELRGLPEQSLCMSFEWVTDFKMDLDFGNAMGPGMLWLAEAREIEGGRWKVVFDFGGAPDGGFEFECNAISQRPSV